MSASDFTLTERVEAVEIEVRELQESRTEACRLIRGVVRRWPPNAFETRELRAALVLLGDLRAVPDTAGAEGERERVEPQLETATEPTGPEDTQAR